LTSDLPTVASFAVPDSLYAELAEICRFAVADGLPWLFPCSRKRDGKLNPIRSENWLKRVLKPACEAVGIEVDLRMFRRGFATIAGNGGGGSLKDIQTQLRHGSITTTANIYVQPVEESVRQVVEQVDRLLRSDRDHARSGARALMTPVRHPDDLEGNEVTCPRLLVQLEFENIT
jgi:integrase